MERIMAASRREKGQEPAPSKKTLEINTASPLIKQLADLQKSDVAFAAEVAFQIYDNAMIQAGLVVDPLAMVERNYKILSRAAGCQ
jgi:molecular chaperone HtpG